MPKETAKRDMPKETCQKKVPKIATEVLPEIVDTREDGYKAVKYEKIVALLIEGMKEQQEQIEKLKSIVKNKKSYADNIQAAWSQSSHKPSEAELKTAAQLAQEGYLSSVKYLRISHNNISEIPIDQLAKLASIATYQVIINKMSHSTQLGTVMGKPRGREKGRRGRRLRPPNRRRLGALQGAPQCRGRRRERRVQQASRRYKPKPVTNRS